MQNFLQTPLQYLKGVGPRRAADLERVGLSTVEDLLCRFPLRYEDRGRLQPISSLRPGQTTTVAAEILSCGLRTTRRPGFRIFEALLRDPSGSIRAVWFNQPYLRDVFQPHQRVVLYGQVEVRPGGGLQLSNPQYEIVSDERSGSSHQRTADSYGVPAGQDDQGRQGAGTGVAADHDERGGSSSGSGQELDADTDETIHTGRIVPVYERAGSVTPKMQRRIAFEAVQRLPDRVDDPIPEAVRLRLGFPDRRSALVQAHFPPQGTSLAALNAFRSPAQVRMIFEEFFLFQAGLVLKRRQLAAERKPCVPVVDDRVREAARRVLPFRLTAGQRDVLKEIVSDMQRPQAMNRMLQGDVGSGKTIVALMSAIVAMENRLQVAFMAPTEILAEQHFITLTRLLAGAPYRVVLLTGGTPPAARRDVLALLASGAAHLVVGTHALVQDPVSFSSLGLVIIDEQHRFGVLQRAHLRAKGLHPDVLVMTATPIPRTLALTTYGDLDVSVIRELPPGRHPIITTVKPESRRPEIYDFIRKEIDAGRQAYVIYPLVEESEKVDLKAATAMADHLAHDVFPEYRVALLHGRMKEDAKDRVMNAFARGEFQILVATTVVEVGIDVPNASVMLVEHAERFGLSQLHQLRGRVGRGSHKSYCLLLYQAPLSDQARDRLKALAETTDGFEIAERDLALRGPGDFFGTRQSGMPTLRTGDLVRDHALMEEARREAVALLDRPEAASTLVDLVRGTWEKRFGLVGVG